MDINLLQNILSECRRIKTIVMALLATQRTSVGPTVDFVVDIFDRSDSSELSGYWIGGAHTLRSGVALEVGPVVNQSGFGTVIGQTLNNSIGNVYALGNAIDYSAVAFPSATVSAANSTTTTKYAAVMSSSALEIEIEFTVNSGVQYTKRTAYSGLTYTGLVSAESAKVQEYALTTLVGIGVFEAGQAAATVLGAAKFPATSTTVQAAPDSSIPRAYPESFTSPDFFVGQLSVGNLSGAGTTRSITAAAIATAVTYVPDYVGGANQQTTALPLTNSQLINVVVGKNTLHMTMNGKTQTVTLNGVQLYSASNGFVVSATTVGLVGSGQSSIGALQTINDLLAAAGLPALSYAGITSFKAWVRSVPKPGNQSGHGLIVNGQPEWADKYHTKVGNSYTYNPAA